MLQKYCGSNSCMMAKFARSADFDQKDIDAYKSCCDILYFDQGENIFEQDSKSDGIYCLQSGNVMLWHMDKVGNEIGFRVAGAGEMCGHRAYFGKDNHTATAVTLTNCVVCCHHQKYLTELMDKYPVLYKLFLQLLARDEGPPDSLLLRNTHLPVKVRLVNLLGILRKLFAKKSPDGSLVFKLPLNRKDISTMIAARPETVARAIKELENSDMAFFSGRKVTVPDIDRLKESVMAGEEN